MITTSKQTTLKQSDDFQSVSFGIKESGLSHIFNVLRNQLYSDKVLAVIREYSTNAVDAHIEVGKADTPIKVTLPTQMTPEFKVRDFGRGLTENQVSEIYAMYGESTKRGTNEQIGQLGLGSKSAFAYGDNFVINSFVKGTKTTYNAFIDPSDVGQISKIHSEKTDENDGIEIVIPVKSDDYSEFYNKATRLYKYFKVIPDVRGASQEQLKDDLKRGEIVVGKDNWNLVKGESYAVMGNIAYPLDYSALNLNWQDEKSDLISSGIVIDFAIGDLEISASREALQYTEKTKKIITNKLDEIIKALPSVLGEKFEECDTLWGTHEIASCKSLILCFKDHWNLIEDFYQEGEDFIYFESFEELEEILNDIDTSFEKYKKIIENAYEKHYNYSVEKIFNYMKTNDPSLITWKNKHV